MVEDKGRKAAAAVIVAGAAGLGLYLLTRIPTAVALPEIKVNVISAPKTTLAVGEAVTVSGELTFGAALPVDAKAAVDIYVNDSRVKTVDASCPKGSSKATYSFPIVFTATGTYTLYTDARWPK
jgi:hypothetical protein